MKLSRESQNIFAELCRLPGKVLLYAVRAAEGIFEYAKRWRFEGEEDENCAYQAKYNDRRARASASDRSLSKRSRLVNIDRRRAYEKYRDIYPIGGFAYNAIVYIENRRYQSEPKQRSAKLNAPKAFVIAEEKALHRRIDQHREEKKLHMLPS